MSWSQQHFITDTVYRKTVTQQFQKQKQVAVKRSKALFSVFNQKLSLQEKEALEFLYAFMPLNDLADYQGDFFLKNLKFALQARDTFAWGKSVPEDIFRHYVLPYRGNNENLDSSREVFFNELKDRIKNRSMRDAALEVNHWCHEKVTYKSTDTRTSSPLNTIKTAYGRCGEESVFSVAAMRAVGIPCRQIYTPRWAHTDDNHAWVEVWIDGKWYYLGACEPEPDLNIAWFSGPVTRAMLLHTRIFGAYTGTEDVVNKNERYTEINVLPAYAPAKRVYVKVSGLDNKPVTNALIECQLYNAAEFYPIAKIYTDSNGLSSIQIGFGDCIIWASHNQLYDYKMISVAKTDTLKLILRNDFNLERTEAYYIVPPAEGNIAQPTDQGREENNRRLKLEDDIRKNYEKTFIDSAAVLALAKKLGINSDSAQQIFALTRGNHQGIARFLEQTTPALRHRALQLLTVISEKDKHDTPEKVLHDHLKNSDSALAPNEDIFVNYILNPRVAYELLTPYKGYFKQKFGAEFIKNTRKDISVLITWINKHCIIDDDANTYKVPIQPRGVYELGYSDKPSRNIFFVAVCRSFGIPARLDAARNVIQYMKNNEWVDVYFEKSETVNPVKGTLILTYAPDSKNLKPQYYVHFSICRFNGASYKSMNYEFSDIFKTFPAHVQLDTGSYCLITGVRMADGSVSTLLKYFIIKDSTETKMALAFKETAPTPDAGFGTLPLNSKFTICKIGKKQGLAALAGKKGAILIWIDPDREPTKHLMADIRKLKQNFEKWSGPILFLIKPDKITDNFNPSESGDLPGNSLFSIDKENFLETVEKTIKKQCNNDFPVVLIIDKTGKIIYTSTGYRIGSGEQILKHVHLEPL